MRWEYDRNLAPGIALAVGEDGIRNQIINIPKVKAPDWAVKMILSVEDYGRLIRFVAGPAKG